MNSKDKLILILFRTPVNSMTVSDQGGGGGAGQRDQACDPRHSHRHILISPHTWSDTEKQAEERGAKAALRKERKAGLEKLVRRCDFQQDQSKP